MCVKEQLESGEGIGKLLFHDIVGLQPCGWKMRKGRESLDGEWMRRRSQDKSIQALTTA